MNPRSHVGHRGKPGSRFNPTVAGSGPDGVSAVSSHPRGDANDPFKLEAKKYKSGREMFDAAKPIRDQHARDTAMGLLSDQSRRDVIRTALKNEGVVTDPNVFGPNADLTDIKKAKKFLQSRPDVMTQAAEAYKPANIEFVQGITRFKIPKLPGYLRAGGLLTAAGLIGDAASASEGIQGVTNETGPKQTSSAMNLTSGVTGLASLAAAPLAIPAAAFGATAALMDNRIERDNRQNRDNDIKDGRIQPKQPDPYTTTITKPEPSTLEKITQDPRNEAEYFAKQAWGGLKSFAGGMIFGF